MLAVRSAITGAHPAFTALAAAIAGLFIVVSYATWRNFGQVSLRRLRYYFVAIPLLLYLTLAMVTRLAKGNDDADARIVIMIGLLGLIAFPSILAIYFRRVRFVRLPRGRVRLKAITDPPAGPSQPARPRPSPQRRRTAVAFLMASLVFFIGVMTMAFAKTMWADDPASSLYTGFGGLLAAICFVLFVMFRRYSQPTADEVLQSDPRPPFLYLRSFDDDFDSHWRPINIIRFLAFPLNMVFDYSLEDRLARLFRRFGPLVAIGSPKEKMPVLGASRVLLDDASWQAAVLKWMDAAKGIVVLAGHTEWLIWEIVQIRERQLTQKAMFIFPPARRKNAGARLETVRRAFAGSPWEASLAALKKPRTLRAMVLRSDGGIVVIRSRSHSRDTIHVTTMISRYLLEKRPEWEPGGAAAIPAAADTAQASEGAAMPVTLRA